MKVIGITCPFCKDFIYSRHNWDFHYCSCKKSYCDGGQDSGYQRFGGEIIVKSSKKEVKANLQQLKDDWNTSSDKFGIIKGKKKQ